MDEQLQRKLLRQLRISNIFMGIVLAMVLLVVGALAFLIWTVVTFTNDVRGRVESIQTQTQQTLDVRQQLCGDSTFDRLFGESNFCRPE